jgi:inosine-uridine nucleoside N-ribohydrolase
MDRRTLLKLTALAIAMSAFRFPVLAQGRSDYPLVLDCDPGWDDAIAIMIVLAKLSASLKGVTVVFGNKSLPETLAFAKSVVAPCYRHDIPVVGGASEPLRSAPFEPAWVARAQPSILIDQKQLEVHEQPKQRAIDFLANSLLDSSNGVTLLATGPLTNIASLLRFRPTATKNIRKIIILGGALRKGNVTKYAEFNFFMDAEAANVVLTAPVDRILIPVDVAANVVLDGEALDKLASLNSPLVRQVNSLISQYRNLEQIPKHNPICIYDAVAACYLLAPSYFKTEPYLASVEYKNSSAFGTLLLEKSSVHKRWKFTDVVTHIDTAAVAGVMLDALCSLT